MSITSDLEKFYDSESDKYHQTRQKHRAESDMILEALENCKKKHPDIIPDRKKAWEMTWK